MAAPAIKKTKANNYGRGWWISYADGHREWVLGMSAQERRVAEAKHGKRVQRRPA